MKYYIEDHGGSPEDCFELKTKWSEKYLRWVAQDAAENYWNNHDGWEASWPLEFVILGDELEELGRFTVDMEAVPQFYAYTKREGL
jgi:hypothetical protein